MAQSKEEVKRQIDREQIQLIQQ